MADLDDKKIVEHNNTQQLKELIKETVIESLNSQDELGLFLEKWLIRHLPVGALQRLSHHRESA